MKKAYIGKKQVKRSAQLISPAMEDVQRHTKAERAFKKAKVDNTLHSNSLLTNTLYNTTPFNLAVERSNDRSTFFSSTDVPSRPANSSNAFGGNPFDMSTIDHPASWSQPYSQLYSQLSWNPFRN